MDLLLLSSSRVGETSYLSHAIPFLNEFLAKQTHAIKLLFIPYAGVTINYDDYLQQVKQALSSTNTDITSLHEYESQIDNDNTQLIKSIENADCIMVGGGNTFALLKKLFDLDILDTLRNGVLAGKAYIGWSAGSNIAGESIKTTNDMPIVEPPSFNALNLLPYQLNLHYTDDSPSGHNGETRQQRLEEFLVANPKKKIIAIAEGTALICSNKSIIYDQGEQTDVPAFIFGSTGKQSITTNTELLSILEID